MILRSISRIALIFVLCSIQKSAYSEGGSFVPLSRIEKISKQADQHMINGDFALAIHAYEMALKIDPNQRLVRQNLSLAEKKAGGL